MEKILNSKNLLNLLKATMLSILVFFSTSFLYVIYRISPLTEGGTYSLEIGFPFKYYKQFQVNRNPFLNSEWNINNLFLDCLITWLLVVGIYLLLKNKK